VFFQNDDDMEYFVEHDLVDKGKAERIPGSGVDLERFAPAEPRNSMGDRPFVFLLATRMLWEKGIAEFVEAARAVKKEHENVKFRLVGPLDVDNPTALSKKDMEKLTSDGVVEYGGVSDCIEKEIAIADCVVLPTFYREGLPRILLEATAMAKPIITTKIPGCTDIVEDGLNGFLCAPQDSQSLGQKMLQMMKLGYEERKAMGEQGRAKAVGEFNQKFVLAKYREAVEALI